MDTLTQMKCVPCRRGEPTLTDAEIAEFHPQVPAWRIVERGGIKRLEQVFEFANLAQALAFTNKVGELAEIEGHHPGLPAEWGRVTVTWWTHKIKDLHRNDFIDGRQDRSTIRNQTRELIRLLPPINPA